METKQDVFGFMYAMYHEVLENFNLGAVEKYFSTSYTQTTDGKTSDYSEFLNHLKALKAHIAKLEMLPFEEFICDGSKVVLRYTVTAQPKFGEVAKIQMLAIFELKDGKIVRCWELSHPLSAEESHKQLATLQSVA